MANKKLKTAKVPNLRFKGFFEEWNIKRLGETMDFKVTNSFSRENLNYKNGNVKNIHYGDIHTKFQTLFDITKEKVPFINEEISLNRISDENYCKEGDIVFADASEDLTDVGKSIEIINLNNEKLLSGLHTLLARPKESKYYKGFNGYLFKSNFVRTQIQKEAQGAKVLSINVGRINKIELTYPSFSEQEKITSFLNLIDNRIYTQSKIIEQLESLIKGLSEKLFSKQMKLKDTNENEFPEWSLKRIEKILSIGSGKDYKNLSKGNIPVYGTGGVMTYVNSFLHNGETVCIGRKGTIDNPIYFKGKIWTVDTLFYTHSFIDAVPKFIFYAFKKINWKEYNEASGVPSLSKKTIEKIEINMPCVAEQTRISNILSSIDAKINIEQAYLIQLENQKKFFQQNLFI